MEVHFDYFTVVAAYGGSCPRRPIHQSEAFSIYRDHVVQGAQTAARIVESLKKNLP